MTGHPAVRFSPVRGCAKHPPLITQRWLCRKTFRASYLTPLTTVAAELVPDTLQISKESRGSNAAEPVGLNRIGQYLILSL